MSVHVRSLSTGVDRATSQWVDKWFNPRAGTSLWRYRVGSQNYFWHRCRLNVGKTCMPSFYACWRLFSNILKRNLSTFILYSQNLCQYYTYRERFELWENLSNFCGRFFSEISVLPLLLPVHFASSTVKQQLCTRPVKTLTPCIWLLSIFLFTFLPCRLSRLQQRKVSTLKQFSPLIITGRLSWWLFTVVHS